MKFSIITVCLNSVKTIEKTIISVISERNVDIEYIIIDGGSTDGTLDIIDKYKNKIDIVISETDRGIFDAMNKGIRYASGDIIAFLNSDDWYEKDALKKVKLSFIKYKCDCICGNNNVILADGSKVVYYAPYYEYKEMYVRMIYFHSAIFAKRKWFLQNNNFDIRYKIAADYNWILSAIKKGMKLVHIDDILFTFNYGGISSINEIECGNEARKIALSYTKDREIIDKINNRFKSVVLNSSERSKIEDTLSQYLQKNLKVAVWGAGVRGKQCIKWLRMVNYEVEIVVDTDASKWGNMIENIIITEPEEINNKAYNIIITPDLYSSQIKEKLLYSNTESKVFTLQELVDTFQV